MIDVVAAILLNEKREVLIAKRKAGKSQGGLWEFPGGKIEEGESPEESLVRELREEMNIYIKVGEYFGENIHLYENFDIRLIAYKGVIISGSIELKDHEEYAWVDVKKLSSFEFAPADISFVERLVNS